jgi:hypothetical protein
LTPRIFTMKPFQHELPVVGPLFNLSPETAPDMDKLIERERAQLAKECAAREFAAKMQRQLSECPGFLGADLPASEASPGRVVIEPSMTLEAVRWLKRRFQVAENLEVSPDNGLAIDIKPRSRRSAGKRHKFTGCRGEQFEFSL